MVVEEGARDASVSKLRVVTCECTSHLNAQPATNFEYVFKIQLLSQFGVN